MKIRNIALGFTLALSAALPRAASAAGGDIYDIIPLWGSTTADNAIKAPGDFGFIIRLLDRDFAGAAPSQWAMQHIGPSSEIYDDVYNPLRIGLVISGRLRYATIDSIAATNTACTDIYCSYTVQPGDFALPALLALEGSTPERPVIAGSGVDGAYYLQNSDLWALQNTSGDTAVFRWCDSGTVSQARMLYPALNRETRLGDESLAKGAFFVKTIDFDENTETKDNVTYWRVVNQGSATTQTYVPRIVADSSPESAITLYVWSDNESAVKVNGTDRSITLADGTTATRSVYSFTLGTQTEYDIAFTGQTQGQTANLILAPTPGHVFDAAGHLVTNFLTRTVYCDAPLAPSINVTFDPAYPTSAKNKTVDTSTNTTENLAADVIPLYVVLSEPYDSDLEVSLRLRLEADSSVDVLTNRNISVSRQGDSFSAADAAYTNFTITAGQTRATVYVYPLGGTAATQSQGITFTPVIADTVAADYYNIGESNPATLKIRNNHTPVIVEPAADTGYGTVEATGFQVPIVISDCYRDLNHPAGFKVTATYSDGSSMTATNVVFNEEAESIVTLTGYGANATYATIRVTEPDGNRYATVRVMFEVAPEKTIRAELYDSTSQESANTRTDYDEGEAPLLRFTLSEAMPVNSPSLYAYLVPQGETASNLVACAAFSNGVEIVGGQTQSSLSLANVLTLLDGCAATETRALQFKIVTGTTPTSTVYSLDTTYTPAAPLVINVRNVYPGTEALYINGDPRNVPSGGHFSTTLSADVTNRFVASVADASNVDVTNGIMVVWCFSEGRSAARFNYSVVTSTTETVTCPHVFTFPGVTQTVQFAAIDKDMLATLKGDKPLKASDLQELWPRITKMVSPYSATVFVGQAPHITITPDIATIYEDEKSGYLSLELSEAPEKDIDIAIAVQSMADSNPGRLEFQTYTLKIKANQTSPAAPNKTLKYKYSTLDGTAGSTDQGFYVTATVLDEDYTNYFTVGECEVYVRNQAPVISPRQPENAYTNTTMAVGQEFTIDWSVTDVMNDLTNGLTAKWYINDVLSKTLVITNSAPTNTTLVLTQEGFNEVKLVVTDKDGEDYNGRSERTWLYMIALTKHLDASPCGPAPDSITKYSTMAGSGRVWADGTRNSTASFAQTWYYNVKSANASVYAYGYPAATNSAGYKDDGTLGENYGAAGYRDVAISPAGNRVQSPAASATYYTYTSPYDNFFYRWAYVTPGEGSAAPTVEYSNPRPTLTAGAGVREVITLDPYEAAKESYETRVVEAVFSREYLQSDNMGDINRDGIPDTYVIKYTGLGVVDANGAVSGDDIEDISTFNDDEDYLPSSASSAYVSFIPGLASTWVAAGRKFDAFTEIRGFCPSLNNAPSLAGIASAKPEVSTNTLKDATYGDIEYDAWLLAGAPTLADGVTPDMDRWSPEHPTDPTKADTDGDEMPDGYEYYIWYRAHVGYWENGEHKFLSGRRYNPMDPGNPGYISPATIASRYDPLVKNTLLSEMDTDNDGLTDLVEFELGTNPFDFDTDADGLPDGYEVLVLETDPLKYATDDVTCDGDLNTDGDAMASALVNMQIIGLAGDNGTVEWFCAPDDTAFQTNAADTAAMGTVFTCAVTENGTSRQATCITTANLTYGTREDGTLYLTCDLSPATTWEAVQADGNYFRNGPVKVMRGTVVTDIAEDQPLLPETLVASPDKCWAAWVYGDTGRLALGAERKHSADELAGRTVVVRPYTNTVELMHFQVYREKGFDPRTGWKTTPDEYLPAARCVNTRNFTARDELLSMSFFCRLGLLEEAAVTPTEQIPWQTIWRIYSTSPLTADTDLDGMPDGWELYMMAGPKVYDKAGNLTLLTSNGQSYGPLGAYSPLASFGDLVGLVRDHDGLEPNKGDGLEWPNEFSGIESAAEYGPKENGSAGTPSITCLNPEWRNKLWPSDPWQADTDGDGIIDGDEGKYFIYGTEGIAGGGLNPLSWDTDHDGLPDPWEMEFRGTWSAGSSGSDSNATGTVTWNNDGMDGTVSDARLDYDSDGLCNWQEYMTGAMRCWRYDDTISPWGMHDFDPDAARADWNGYWYAKLVDEQGQDYNPHLVAGTFDPGIYFSRCTNAWDGARVHPNPVHGKYYMFRDGVYHDLKYPTNPKYKVDGTQYNKYTYPAATAGWRGFVPPFALLSGRTESPQAYPVKYITCDPRMADTDRDGMDDYYELFHGMNPLLGESGVHKASGNAPYDVVFDAYNMVTIGGWSAENNYWLNPDTPHRDADVKDPQKSMFDFMAYPWLGGLGRADPDGDNVRNQIEAIMPNFQAASTYLHTDPTPLWMTDTSYTNSFTRRYYRAYPLADARVWSIGGCPNDDGSFEYDGVKYYFRDFPGFGFSNGKVTFSYSANIFGVERWMFDFEENEGYDSDHDYLGDFEEGQARNETASDPQGSDSPLRRQAMWFNGVDAFLQSPLPAAETPPRSTAGGEPRQDFLYYTVECWAKPAVEMTAPDCGLRTLVERAVAVDNANAADERFVRRNFLVGIQNGRWYTRFDTSGTDDGQYVEINDGPEASTNWTHVAATYDGENLRLFVNGICRVLKPTSLQPEHGLKALAIEDASIGRGLLEQAMSVDSEEMARDSYLAVSMLVGASARNTYGVAFDYAWMRPMEMHATTIADYTAFYKGYIDEVRVWDGARAPSQILADYEARTRYTAKAASDNRDEVYAMWRQGARRSLLSDSQLPAQLMYHWSFDHLPGAVRAEDVPATPAGFATDRSVADAMASWARPADWVCPWWDSVAVRSTVYSDSAWVPWISDTVAHLPRLDQTVLDSVYWSGNFVGSVPAAEYAATNGYSFTSLAFPRTHELYSTKWVQHLYPREEPSFTKDTRWNTVVAADEASGDASSGIYRLAYRFTMRDSQLTGHDLLPMGGAYPRRISKSEGGMWDDGSPSDAWPITAGDSDNNGLPDWWEDYARQNYCDGIDPDDPLTRETEVVVDGIGMPAWKAYMRDLAAGMVMDENGRLVFDEGYISTHDASGDGIPDWWQNLFGLADGTADEDPDNDGLSNYQEYMLSEVYPGAHGLRALTGDAGWNAPVLNPLQAYSGLGQMVPDYFLCYTNLAVDAAGADGRSHYALNQYFGGIVTDHDFMEDWWENLYGVSYTSAKKYDPLDDRDEDGWSTWAECRASLWGGYFNANLIDRWTGALTDLHVTCHPEPIVAVRPVYHGAKDVSGAQLVVRTYTGQRRRVDATFRTLPFVVQLTKYIGPFYADAVLHGHMSPGLVNPQSIVFESATMDSEKTYHWNWTWYIEHGITGHDWEEMPRFGDWETYRYWYALFPHISLEGAELDWQSLTLATASADEATAVLSLADSGAVFGKVDCLTGEYEMDMSKFTGDLANCVFRVTYSSRPGHEWPQTVYLSDTRELGIGDSTSDAYRGSGYVREGLNTVEAFFDLDGDGAYTPGEPFGTVQNVDVGWHKTAVAVIELRDVSHIVPRYSINAGVDDRAVVTGISYNQAASGGQADSGDSASGSGGDGDKTGVATKRIAIRRKTINGISEVAEEGGSVKRVPQRIVMSRNYVLDDRAYITEADVLGSTVFDLDWKKLVADADNIGIKRSDIRAVGYDIEEVATLSDGSQTNMLLYSFINTFNDGRGTASLLAPRNLAPVCASSPTFAFTSSDDTMTAYRLQIKSGDATGALMYDSGISALPGRVGTTVGTYAHEITPAIFAGEPVMSGLTNGTVFADCSNYVWRVALYNAKYNDDADAGAWSSWASFKMDVKNADRYPLLPTGYGKVAAAVRYYGASRTNDLSGKVVVEAFQSADFRGQPLAQRRASTNMLDSAQNISSVDAIVEGVAPGTVFLRAYIDLNGNGRRENWEPWGYANNVGKSLKAIYNPWPVEVSASTGGWIVGEKADVTIFMEDCDVNKNEIPDGLEPDAFASGAEASSDEAVTWETWADVDLALDADYAPNGDVMAYREFEATLVRIWDGSDASNVKRGLLAPGATAVPAAGDDATLVELFSTFDYNGLYGLGAPFAAAAGWKVYEKPQKVAGVLLHAQVYDAAGFNPKTAAPVDDAVDTKPFTTMDKRLLVRYLENTGRIDENYDTVKYESFEAYMMDKCDTSLYAKYTLKPDEIDGDRDGMADGWELYVMSGPAGAASAQTGVSPWNFSDRALDLDGDGLANVDEYDSGYLPTDPWNGDSAHDGLGDKAGRDFHFKYGENDGTGRTGYRGDWDNDQLSNLAEYMISSLDGFPALDASAMSTYGAIAGQLVPDYFLRHGKLYLGEMFADHDMIEDWWEDSIGVEQFFYSGSARREGVSRYSYDAHRDRDGDGWSNWAEARAWIAAGSTQKAVVSTNVVDGAAVVATNIVTVSAYDEGAGRPTPAVPVRIIYGGRTGNLGAGTVGETNTIIIKAWSQTRSGDPNMSGQPDAIWSTSAPNQNGLDFSGVLRSSGGAGRYGYLREGLNTIVAYITDEDTSAGAPQYRPGKPFGVAVDVNVGHLAGDPVTIEMTDVNPSTVRINLADAISRQSQYASEIAALAGSTESPETQAAAAAAAKASCFNDVAAATDRGVWNEPSAGLYCPYFVGTNILATATNDVVVKVMRSLVNGVSAPSAKPIIERKFKYADHPVFTELDLMREMIDSGKWDFDWGGARSTGLWSVITSATYRIVVGTGSTSNFDWNNNLAVAFENRFEAGSYQTPVSDCEVTGVSGQPTFRWRHTPLKESGAGKLYPAFQLRIWESDGTTLVYDSGVQRAPARDANGVYSWTAPVWTGMLTPQNKVFRADTDYIWGVSMLDAKFNDPLPANKEGRQALRVSDNTGLMSDYGQIAVAVKYMGPGEISTTEFAKMLRVEAYMLPDFSGSPYAVAYVRDAADIADSAVIRLNALLRGLPKGAEYYVKAFIDSNGNGVRDDWESWGYCNHVGDASRADVYTPRAVAVEAAGAGDMQTPDCVIYIEDADTNNNKLPDVWEYDQDGELGGASATGVSCASPYFVTLSAAGATGAVNMFQSIASGAAPDAVQLPYWSQLVRMANGESIASASLALAMAGINLDDIVAKPVVSITSFSLDDGISIEVDPRATVDGTDITPSVVAFNVSLEVNVEYTDDLTSGAWTSLGSVTETFSVGAGATEVPQSVLDSINGQIKTLMATKPSAFFRVNAVVGGSRP